MGVGKLTRDARLSSGSGHVLCCVSVGENGQGMGQAWICKLIEETLADPKLTHYAGSQWRRTC